MRAPLEDSDTADGSGLRRVALTWVNHAGATLVKVVPMHAFRRSVTEGVGFSPVSDAFRTDGAIASGHRLAVPDGDLRLRADPASLAPLEPATGWGWAAGDRWQRDDVPYAADQRLFCRAQSQRLAAAGLSLSAGFELEWMLAEPGADGSCRPTVAGGPYGGDRLVNGLDYASALLDALEDADLPWLQFHPEYGASQFELSLAPAAALEAADRLVRARLVIQRVSERIGAHCSFSPKPCLDGVGNGGHLHFSVQRNGTPLLEGGGGEAGLTAEGASILAAVLDELPGLMALTAPSAVSYLRLVPGTWAAPFQVWGVENREAALRLIPAAADHAPAHAEIKVVDLMANPYLVLGALQAVVGGALQPLRQLPAPVHGDPERDPNARQLRLPRSLEESSAAFAASTVLVQAMGESLHGSLLDSMAAELQRSAGRTPAQLVQGLRWWPLVGGAPAPVRQSGG
ncbi:glutamine synthetase [Synechococcus sp. RSCCF101]|uniref:glutamine synthetase n=1 Tax=Synechococcus sp. RSCCF101 TaxID=2511069 RepID=UPI001246D232|nr:glutamine synthetase [Synechococcus sp. RSCCF101]QEY33077.1 glutamine synthetase [Synechococcus sp. RSCCF101]